MNPEQISKVTATIWEIAENQVGLSRYPFFAGTPTEQTAKLGEILKATSSLLRLLQSLDHRVGQPLEEHPFDAPLMQAIQVAHTVNRLLTKGGPKASDIAEDYPSDVIHSLREFKLATERARNEIKPKRGNATNRNQTSVLKSAIAKNLVFLTRSQYGAYPATSADGWAANLLNEIFQKYHLGDDAGAHWLRHEVTALRKAQSPG